MNPAFMAHIPIYADFNDLEGYASDSSKVLLDLTGYGTLASLSLHKLRLHIGQRLLLSDFDGLEALGEIGFDITRVSKYRSGWFAKFSRSDIKHVLPREHDYSVHMCFKCRRNLRPYLDQVGQNFREECPHCGTPVVFPLLPPEGSN